MSKQSLYNHSSIKPLTTNDIKDTSIEYEFGSPFKKLNEASGQNHKVQLGFYPIAEIAAKVISDVIDTTVFDLGIGAAGVLRVGESFNGRIEFSASRFQYPLYVESEVRRSAIGADGQLYHQYNKGYHSTNLNGFLDYKPGEVFSFRAGHGRNFIGEGYRSMMLSDNAGNYSYGRITADVWRMKYMVLYAHLKDMGNSASRNYMNLESKFATIHYLSWNITKKFNLGFFESVVWPGRDTLIDRGMDVNYLNPVIFMRPVEYSTGSSDNSLLGMSFNYKPKDNRVFYSQFVLDEFLLDELVADAKDLVKPDVARQSGWWANKYAIQLGLKTFDLFGLKGIGFQTEMNLARPFTYSHGNSKQNYGHLNRALAHPLEANFVESISFLSYSNNNSLAELKFQYYQQGLSTDSTNFGEDIFKPYQSRRSEYGNYLGQGVNRTITAIGLTYNYILVPETNLRLFGDFTIRNQKSKVTRTDIFLSVGIRSNITNRYTDI